MAVKKSITDLLPDVDTTNDPSEFPFRFNRLVLGDYQDTEQKIYQKDEEKNLHHILGAGKRPRQFIPPAGIPPPTAADLFRLKKNQPAAAVDYCMPVQYQYLNSDAQELEGCESASGRD